MKADLYLVTYAICNLPFKAIKNIGSLSATTNLFYWTIDRWFHLHEQEQDHCYQGYGLGQKNLSTIKQLSRTNPKSCLKILPSKTNVSWKQARMVECGFLRKLT